jgi:hypothetical protein
MNISTHTYKETKKEREREGNCLPSTANKWRKKKTTTAKEKNERESDDHAHAHTHIKKWHSRRSERKIDG